MSAKKSFKEIIKSSNKALLIGIGGGGDIVGNIPTAEQNWPNIKFAKLKCFLGLIFEKIMSV